MVKINKLRIAYFISLIILGLLFVFAFFRPLNVGNDYSSIQKEQLLKTKDGYIVQFDLINQEKEDVRYEIAMTIDGGSPYEESVNVSGKGIFTYVHHINMDNTSGKRADIAIFKEGETEPFETATYYLN